MKELHERVVEILADMAGVSVDEVDPQDSFESLDLDSLDLVEMTLIIEDELGVEVDRDDFTGVTTIQDALDRLEATVTTSN
jgi:acyl carrier protein